MHIRTSAVKLSSQLHHLSSSVSSTSLVSPTPSSIVPPSPSPPPPLPPPNAASASSFVSCVPANPSSSFNTQISPRLLNPSRLTHLSSSPPSSLSSSLSSSSSSSSSPSPVVSAVVPSSFSSSSGAPSPFSIASPFPLSSSPSSHFEAKFLGELAPLRVFDENLPYLPSNFTPKRTLTWSDEEARENLAAREKELLKERAERGRERERLSRRPELSFPRQPLLQRKGKPEPVFIDVYCQMQGYFDRILPLLKPQIKDQYRFEEHVIGKEDIPPLSPKASGAILTFFSPTDRWKERMNPGFVKDLIEKYRKVCLVLLKPIEDPSKLSYVGSRGFFADIKQLCVANDVIYDIPHNRAVLEEVLRLLTPSFADSSDDSMMVDQAF